MKLKFVLFLSLLTLLTTLSFVLADNDTTLNLQTITNPLPCNDILSCTTLATKILIGLALVVTPLIIIYAGFLFITAAGNDNKVKTAQKILTWAIIGFILVLLATGIPDIIKQFLNIS